MTRLQEFVYDLFETPDKQNFEKFKTPEEIHFLAQNWTWETDEEVRIFKWIAESDLCSQATALLIFWGARADDFTCYKLGTAPQYGADIFDIIQIILRRFSGAEYEHFGIRFDPAPLVPDENIAIKAEMKKSVSGEETWYDEKYIEEVYSFFPNELANEIARCDDPDYLNMFARGFGLHSFFYADTAEKTALWIMDHPLCDMGTALLLYWRLLRYFFHCGFLPEEAEDRFPVIRSLLDKLMEKAFPDRIEYDPLTDEENMALLGKTKKEWEIPDFMKRPV